MPGFSVETTRLQSGRERINRLGGRVAGLREDCSRIRSALDWDVKGEQQLDQKLSRLIVQIGEISDSLQKAGGLLGQIEGAYAAGQGEAKRLVDDLPMDITGAGEWMTGIVDRLTELGIDLNISLKDLSAKISDLEKKGQAILLDEFKAALLRAKEKAEMNRAVSEDIDQFLEYMDKNKLLILAGWVLSGKPFEEYLADWICSYIPRNIDEKSILGVYEKLSDVQGNLLKKEFPGNLATNIPAFGSQTHMNTVASDNGFIEDQSNYTDMKYGDQTVAYSGCEVIATYNAMVAMNCVEPGRGFPELLQTFEKDGIVLNGEFGTSPYAVVDYFRNAPNNEFDAAITTDASAFDSYGNKYDTLILTMYNNGNDIRDMVHTVSITKDASGQFFVHNCGCENTPFNSVSDALSGINGGTAKGISLIGISKV
ncbi:MAG TPA: hypothetical protein VHT96_18550 [Clostridia bacterium]|nr:hypothetical protein [Clostridia bacterium]